MERPKLLSGEQLVAKGVTKIDASLPEVGMKDVLPNGSWLEQKQIQAALEARKHLVETERIEKRGVLSHASWSDDLKLAEVTQQAGGYWQYLGYNVGKKLFLMPEEALFLMETNCLLLKHNEIVVSLQKAYSLLLIEPIGIQQYKVYASLSRTGYKVFRHRITKLKESINTQNKEISSLNKSNIINESDRCNVNLIDTATNAHEEASHMQDDPIISKDTVDFDSTEQTVMNNSVEMSSHFNIQENNTVGTDIKDSLDINDNLGISGDVDNNEVINNAENYPNCKNGSAANVENRLSPFMLRLQALENRQFKPCSSESLHKKLDFIPDLFMKTVVTVNVPDEQYIPRNVFVDNTKYVLNLNVIRSKPTRCPSNETTYSTRDEVNAPHIRRLRSSSRSETPRNNYNENFNRNSFLRQQNFMQFRSFNFWRPQQNNSNIPLNMFFPRPFPNFYVSPQFSFAQNPFITRPIYNPFSWNFIPNRMNMPRANYNPNNSFNAKLLYLQTIKSLATKTKNLGPAARMNSGNIHNLRKLVDLYNATYNCRLRLTNTCDVIDEANIVETIELDDDDEPRKKKSRKNSNMFDENLRGIKDLVTKLKVAEMNNGYKSKYRRVLSNIIKKFNSSYNADIYLNEDCEIIDRKHITLESSSDSDCMITETVNHLKRKKLPNPFSGIKRHAGVVSTTSNQNVPSPRDNVEQSTIENCATKSLERNFDKTWLPNKDDFGKPEVVSKCPVNSRLVDATQNKYLYEFIKNDSTMYDNWLEIKIAYLKYLEESNQVFQDQQKLISECNVSSTGTGLKPLLRPEDCSDMGKVLERLRIISNNKDTGETKYRIDFDVYNRDIKNFRKSNPPKPHFRIVCVDESGSFPNALDVATLNLEYQDNIPILFAVVGMASISYVQVNCVDLPIYLPRRDLT
ncbi:hypothetical protein K1T71_007379 [Dendrolimus kikuchii]|uniref:Uncharacterized protein n=1 Tax=Dendrolimus kikuchii TaxID=765133 RepID=A0ACC1D0M0_9NEOP|nr:hypothetical protein K1T71_007379 [Dendrolimus kikuchii]